MFKYHTLNPIADIGISEFNENYVPCDDFAAADCVLVRSADMHKLTPSEKLLAVGRAGAGVNNIPLDEYAKKGIVVFNTPGANANGVKELVLAGMFYASRGIFEGMEWLQKEGIDNPDVAKTAEKQKKNYAGTELNGKKLGVIGLGAIGVKVANAATNLGMTVYGYDPYISVDAAWHLSRSIKHVHQVEEIYANCDYITIHVPLLDSTRHMINAESIKLMKDTAILLNFARDELVDEESVVAALKVGKLRKYVSDFPNPVTVGKEGCIVTPHLGASTEESEDNCAVMAVKELRDYMENGNIKNSVNFPDINMGVPETVSRIMIFHNNVANVLTRLTSAFGDEGINIATMNSKSKGERAVTILDLDGPPTESIMTRVEQAKEVIRVRVVK